MGDLSDPLLPAWNDDWCIPDGSRASIPNYLPYNDWKKRLNLVCFRVIYEKHVNPSTKKIKRIIDETMIITEHSEAHLCMKEFCKANNYEFQEIKYELPAAPVKIADSGAKIYFEEK